MIELTIIKLLLSYSFYLKYGTYVYKLLSLKELKSIYLTLSYLHDEFKKDLTLEELELSFKTGSDLDKKKYEPYALLFKQLSDINISPEIAEKALESLRERAWLSDVTLLAMDALEGRKTASDVINLVKEKDDSVPLDNEAIEFVTDDLALLKTQTYATPGLRWRLDILNKALGSLRPGDFGFVFARPESGKTTFLASEASFMAGQLANRKVGEYAVTSTDVSFGDDGQKPVLSGPILWFNNEEQGRKPMLRCIQAATGCTLAQLFSDVEKYKKLYYQLTGGLIRIVDRASISKQEVEKICKATKPSLIIYDQIDKIKGFEADRNDLQLGAIYIWAREISKEYAPSIGVCQADGSGEGQRWLTMANVSNAKTSKQSEADWILGIGKTNDPGMDYVRYLHLSKNKLMGDEDSIPDLRHMREEVIIDPHIARYHDPMGG